MDIRNLLEHELSIRNNEAETDKKIRDMFILNGLIEEYERLELLLEHNEDLQDVEEIILEILNEEGS